MSEQAVIAHRPPLAAHAEGSARGSLVKPLAVAGLCLLALGAVWALAELVPAIRVKDAVALYEFTTLNSPRVETPLKFLLHLLDPSLFILWAIALVAIALASDRPRVALAVGAVLILAPFTAEQLKPLLAHEHDSVSYVVIGAASWPSGHAAAAMALVLSAVLVAPHRLRPYVAVLGGAYMLAVSVALLVLAWHMPSDVLGGILVATFWMALAVAALRLSGRVLPPKPTRPAS
jgi:membrane-associated phospholipid phosphatase